MSQITQQELTNMFPDGMPFVVGKLLFPEKLGPLTPDELRQICTAFSLQQMPKDPIGYRSQMELMHRLAGEARQHGMSARAEELRDLLQGLEREFPEAEALIQERWGTARTASKEGR